MSVGELDQLIGMQRQFVEVFVEPHAKGERSERYPLPVNSSDTLAEQRTLAKEVKDLFDHVIEIVEQARTVRSELDTQDALQKISHQTRQVLARHGRRRAR